MDIMKDHSNSKTLRIAGHIFFLVLVAMSVVFANERVIYSDSAAQLFEMIQRGTFVIYDYRYAMAITQTLPLLCIKAGFSLKAVVIAYSVAAPLLSYLAFLLIAYPLKNVRLGLVLLLPLLCIRHTFFHAISETCSLFIYATLLAAFLSLSPTVRWKKALNNAGIVISCLLCVFIHPIGMFFAAFLLGYRFVNDRFKLSVAFVIGAITLTAAATVKMLAVSGHDAEFMPNPHEIPQILTHFFSQDVVHHFANRLLDFYIYPIILYCIVLLWHITHRQWLRMAYGIVFNICFIAMTVVVYRLESSPIGVERSFLPLMFFAGLPFLCEILPSLGDRKQKAFILLFSALLLLAFGKIADTSRKYHQRLEKIEEIAEAALKTEQHKLVTDKESIQGVFKIDSWGTAFESIIITSLGDIGNTVTLFVEEETIDKERADYQTSDCFIAVPWWRLWPLTTLNPNYFKLPEQPYKQLTFDDGKPIIKEL